MAKIKRMEQVAIEELKPYERNAKIHGDRQIEQLAKSIKQFGFINPVLIDKKYNVIAGHGRIEAAKTLNMQTVPCLFVEGLTDKQRKAFILADNKLAELSEWNYDILNEEIEALTDFDMEDFGFEFDFEIPDYKEETQERVENILNLGIASYQGVGKYDIPQLKPVKKLPKITEWIGFNYVLSDKNPAGKAVHFFVDDYQFERVWNNPDKYIEKLKQYAAVATPDFSPYADMPLATQIYNHYRKHWIGRYMQDAGITVIPTIRASVDPRSMEWYLEGEPAGGIVLISSMWATKNNDTKKKFLEEYNTMLSTLKPIKVLLYGSEIGGLEGNIERIPTFTDKKWGRD